ncbi:superinfection exclusion B family protein [Bradyrhizobium sp. WSM 1738]|uniref:super-infection exclusion protein B n=1 Tax=Bradyrhizobium hereditatis TaxID=2821405 RepID=UPI001CE30E29|nr:super-infection exclusion protein B [Bradyrhizobium hereditatis]MCA6114959.1 superinfection exclusion B family protein [Bradyrhizobium hereditatis]
MAIPDPRWLEILKASGWQTAAVSAACGLFLLFARWSWLPPLDPWMIQLAAIAGLICGFLAIASFISAALKFFPVQTWVLHAVKLRRAKRAVRDYIPFMTEEKKKIVAYMLAKNQKMFTAESDGGYAASLLSRGIVVVAARPGQHITMSDVPMAVPDHVWDVLIAHKDHFRINRGAAMISSRIRGECHGWRDSRPSECG